ncbi:Thioredoxin H-type [Seminavis robusta]|uniref:Thioredoxin H-type n=1 Tax=Seminavis robusta TaxID=568900 RepID=A0A9N8HMQ3_9STRA|nr:Thioredoxin H-type [Seminavis robusta]|eukprot:Sro763_g198930.1 Thioredoxin H-type (169) ;mRNA; r:32715-33221
MSTICFGGICVPYTAVMPLLFLGLRWLLQKAIELGLIPKSVQEKLFPSSTKYAPTETSREVSGGSGGVTVVESEEAFREILKNPYVVCKFTAAWCKPCQKVHPEYVQLSKQFTSASFITVDVDDLDEIASEYKVAMMPTFLVFRNGRVKETKTGIDLLEDFVSKALKD